MVMWTSESPLFSLMQFFSASAYAKGTLLGACFIGLADVNCVLRERYSSQVIDTVSTSFLLLSSSHMNAGRGLVDVTEHFVHV